MNKLISKINFVKVKAYLPLFFFGVVILLEFLVATFYFPKKVFSLLERRDELKILSGEVAELALAATVISAVDGQKLESELLLATKALPDEKKVAGLTSGLSFLASGSGVLATSIAFAPGVVSTQSGNLVNLPAGQKIGGKVLAVPVMMAVTSSLDQFLDYVKRILAASQLLGVTSIDYTLSSQNSGGSMSLLVYYLPGRTGKLSWKTIPVITSEDIDTLKGISPNDIFSLPLKPQ